MSETEKIPSEILIRSIIAQGVDVEKDKVWFCDVGSMRFRFNEIFAAIQKFMNNNSEYECDEIKKNVLLLQSVVQKLSTKTLLNESVGAQPGTPGARSTPISSQEGHQSVINRSNASPNRLGITINHQRRLATLPEVNLNQTRRSPGRNISGASKSPNRSQLASSNRNQLEVPKLVYGTRRSTPRSEPNSIYSTPYKTSTTDMKFQSPEDFFTSVKNPASPIQSSTKTPSTAPKRGARRQLDFESSPSYYNPQETSSNSISHPGVVSPAVISEQVATIDKLYDTMENLNKQL